MCSWTRGASSCDERHITTTATTAARTESTTYRRRRVPAGATPGLLPDGWRRRSDHRPEDLGSTPEDSHRTGRRWTAFLASCSKRSPGRVPGGRESPLWGTTWRRPIGRRSRHRLGRLVSDRPQITVHLFDLRHQPVLDFSGRAGKICCRHWSTFVFVAGPGSRRRRPRLGRFRR
jgi:hypothetical protein